MTRDKIAAIVRVVKEAECSELPDGTTVPDAWIDRIVQRIESDMVAADRLLRALAA